MAPARRRSTSGPHRGSGGANVRPVTSPGRADGCRALPPGVPASGIAHPGSAGRRSRRRAGTRLRGQSARSPDPRPSGSRAAGSPGPVLAPESGPTGARAASEAVARLWWSSRSSSRLRPRRRGATGDPAARGGADDHVEGRLGPPAPSPELAEPGGEVREDLIGGPDGASLDPQRSGAPPRSRR